MLSSRKLNILNYNKTACLLLNVLININVFNLIISSCLEIIRNCCYISSELCLRFDIDIVIPINRFPFVYSRLR